MTSPRKPSLLGELCGASGFRLRRSTFALTTFLLAAVGAAFGGYSGHQLIAFGGGLGRQPLPAAAGSERAIA